MSHLNSVDFVLHHRLDVGGHLGYHFVSVDLDDFGALLVEFLKNRMVPN